jgi:hypothetical protein
MKTKDDMRGSCPYRSILRLAVVSAPAAVAVLFAAALVVGSAMPAQAQNGELVRARLASSPPYGVPQSATEGSGQVWWALDGSTLEVHGGFMGLTSRATTAAIHVGQMTAVMGAPVLSLEVRTTPDGTSGLISGTANLTPGQVEALGAGRFYVQLNSADTSETGHLQGWLLK